MSRRVLIVVSVLCALALASPALAQTGGARRRRASGVAPGITLTVTPTRLLIGKTALATGSVSPVSAGEAIQIVNRDGNVIASTTTNSAGKYEVEISPRKRTVVRARWDTAQSDPIQILVTPKLSVNLTDVKLFGRAKAAGRLRPAHPGGAVTVRLFRNGRLVSTKKAPLRDGRRYRVRFRIQRPGSFQARTTFDDDDHVKVVRRSDKRSPLMPSLKPGSTGSRVRLLERRLYKLGYHLRGINRKYDHRTSDAVIAFNKVQGRARVGAVDESTWRALAEPKRPRPRSTRPRFHVEIDQTKQVVYLVRRGRVVKILHTSTGAGGATRDGVFSVHRKLAGYSPNRLYYPSYFDGLRAIHGWPEVPTYPASHGCARVPMWAAQWIYGKVPIGTEVRVYH